MSDPRKPTSEAYDAAIDIVSRSGVHDRAMALVKKTYEFHGRSLRPAPAEPLLHDFRDPELVPRLRPGTDFWREKKATDVVVLGSAFAPGGRPVARSAVSVSLAGITKKVAVFGRRQVAIGPGGAVRFGPPEPFSEMPLGWENAYGGVDPRVDVPGRDDIGVQILLKFDHPGLYPRNPFGKGYLVIPEPVDGLELPNLEDPADLLTPERLFVRDPRLWYRQPLPWSYGWIHPMMFPRYVFLTPPGDAWYPGPDDEKMPEVARGFLPPRYRELPRETGGPHPLFYQEASQGMAFPKLRGGERILLEGFHQEENRIEIALPERGSTKLQFIVEGKAKPAEPALHHVVLRPAEKKVNLVFGATFPLPRAFIPGIHKHIPVAISVDGDRPVSYMPPQPIKEAIAEAAARSKRSETS